MSLKLVSVNIEANRHLDRVVSFLQKEAPDVALMQEVFEADIPQLQAVMPGNYSFYPMAQKLYGSDKHPENWGIALFSKLPFEDHGEVYYGLKDSSVKVPLYPHNTPEEISKVVGWIKVTKESDRFTLLNTHFTWTPNGWPNDIQRADLQELLAVLTKFPEFVLCGDFNAPRGRPVWTEIANLYQDNIPSETTTTIDAELHRKGDLQLVVDGIFTTPGAKVSDVRVVSGVSDHCALVAELSKS